MRWRISVLIGSALGCGMLASMLVAQWTGPAPTGPAAENTARVFVALRDLRDGETLTERNVALVHWPVRGLPPGAVEKLEDMIDRVVDGPLAAGQPIQAGRLRDPGADVAASEPAEAPSAPAPAATTVAIELAGRGAGPWIVSTGEKLHVTPLEEACREAAEVAKRNAAATPEPPTPPVDERPAATLEEPIVAAPEPVRNAARTVPVHVERAPWASSIVTPEGAKILRWRAPSDVAPPASDSARPGFPIRTTRGRDGELAPAVVESLAGRPCELVGRTLAGRDFDWDAYRGRPVLVVVHLARSAKSREELALVERVIESYRPRGLAVVGASLDDDLETVRAFASHNRIAWPIVVGPHVRQWARESGLERPLALLVVDEEGRIAGAGARAMDVTTALAWACDDAAARQPSVRQARRGELSNAQP